MESISRLRAILLTSLGSRGAQHGEQELFDELMVHQQRLLTLLDVGPRNAQEQREIESGKTVVNGRPLAVNADFARQVIFLSQQLDCSERYVAGILHTIMSQNPNISTVDCLEAVIVEFHLRRRHLVDCLRYIFEAAELAESVDAPRIFVRLDAFTRQQLIPTGQSSTGESNLALELFKEIENLGVIIGKVQGMKQNAVSNTAAPSNQGNPTLGHDILTARLDSLKYERRYLAHVLFLIARLGYLSSNEIKKLVDWLALNPNHSMTYNILTATLVAFDPVNPESRGGKAKKVIATDHSIISYMKTKLDPSAEWKDQGLKATILLKWTLLLTDTRHRDHSLENREGFKTEDLETRIWNAVQGDAFVFLAQAVIHLQRTRGSSPVSSYARSLALSYEQEQQRDLPADDFKPAVLQSFENLVRSLITHASSELRKIKQRQEDLVMSSARTDRSRFRVPSIPSPADHVSPRNDIAMLYSFIGLLYSALPVERALQFWGAGPPADSPHSTYLEQVEASAGKLPTFLQWAVWSTQLRDQDMSMALYDMLAGLAKGQHCSELAYNFMARGGGEVIPGSSLPSSSAGHYQAGQTVSWTTIFGQLESWATLTANSGPNPAQAPLGVSSFTLSSSQPWQAPTLPHGQQIHQHVALSPKETSVAQAFLRLLSNVVTHSVAVRIAISGNAQFRAIPTLVSLIPLGIPLELKGAIFETLAAFSEPGAGIPGIEICKAVWTLMERLEVINVRGGSGFASKGVEVEFVDVEASAKYYPSTIPFLKLLSTLIHSPKRVQLKDRVTEVEPTNTTPESLGQPYRLPGLGPFISFVIDTVFLTIQDRDYAYPSDRWQTNDLCLSFIERCLASYDLESLVSSEDDVQLRGELLGPLLVHPGYDVIKRLLTNSPLQAKMISYLVEGVDAFESGFAEEEPYFRSTITRVFRIIHRTLEIQDIFIDVLVPLLSEFDSAPIVGAVHSRSYYTKIDQALSFGPQYVPAIAAYVGFPAHPELVLLSVKILTYLSTSAAFTNLATLIERSGDSDRILNGFRLIMETETLENVTTSEATAEQTTGAGAPDREGSPDSLEQAIRLATLDFFIQNTEQRRPYPNIAHFMLFGEYNNEQPIQDPHALGAHKTCIHVILDMLNAGVPRIKGKISDQERQLASQTDPLFVTLPALAERCYRVIYQLCNHSRTSDFTMRYLRTREDFFARHLAAIPSEAPATHEEPFIEVLYNDGSRVTTTVSALSSFLRLRSWILDLVALDLHVLTNKGHYKGVTHLLEILFGNEGTHHGFLEWEDDSMRPFHEVGQSHLRIIEFIQSLAFDWSDSLTVRPIELEFLGQLNLQSCIRNDSAGCEIVDRAALFSLLAAAKRSLHSQGRIVTQAHVEQLNAETAYILESCAVENHRREIVYSTATGYESWRKLLDTTLMKCFGRLPHERRENMLFDILHVLPTIIRLADVQESTAVLLSEAVLSSITKLREDRSQQTIIQSAGGDADAGSLPIERLKSLLRSLLECMLDNNRLELVRGNLYAALINYVHLITSTRPDADVTGRKKARQSLSLSTSITQEDFFFSDSQSSVGFASQTGSLHGTTSVLESGSLAVMKGIIERLVTTIARDAIDGTEVWKTIAFMTLDSLVHLSRSEKPPIVLSALVRHGILANFVRGLKESDLRLQAVLKPDPDDLNPLYVFEAKMSLFIRMAQSRLGAEKLLEAQILPTLAQCDFLDARPEADQSFMDQDTFLPSAIQRYHQLFMPVLQLVHGILATLGSKHSTATHQALHFITCHRDTIIILIKNESDYVTVSLIDEIHLLVSLSASIIPIVPKAELVSVHSGYGGIHGAVLSLAAKCLGSGRWVDDVRPQTDTEILNASVYAPGYKSETKFEASVHQKEVLLRQAMVAYLGAASEFTEPEITLVLSPVTSIPRQEERNSRFVATIPTVGDAVEALNDICDNLTDTLKQIADLSAELASRDQVRVDNIQDIINVPDTGFFQELDIGQKRSLVCQELERIKIRTQSKAKIVLSTLEMLLLLLWRHLAYYSEGQHINNPDLKTSTSHAMRFVSSPDAGVFQSEVGIKLAPVLQRLPSLDLDEDTIGDDWRSNQGYIEIMCRRLRDTAGLHDTPK